MKSEDVIYQKVYVSPQPPPTISYKDNWMKELLDSEVAGSRKDTQRIQPKPKNPIVENGETRRWTRIHPGRGTVADDLFRRLVSRTNVKQFAKEVEADTVPCQHGRSTRAGCESVAHVIEGLCEMNPTATITSIFGIAAYDPTSRKAMPQGIHHLDGVLPFVEVSHVPPSMGGRTTQVPFTTSVRAEERRQGDALMPFLLSQGQHGALQAAQRQLRDQDRLAEIRRG